MKIVLLGYMGSGKSTVGKLLATDLDIDFIDLDSYIERKLDDKITDIFREKGEIFFRKKEHHYLKEVISTERDFVLALGGGTPCYSKNMDYITFQTKNVFYLMVSVPSLTQRLAKERVTRPLIKHISETDLPEFIGKHLLERSEYYIRANHVILCDNKEIPTIASEIKALISF